MALAAHKPSVQMRHQPIMRHAPPLEVAAMPTSNIKPRSLWQDIAREVTQEKDPVKLLELTKELNDAMVAEEREKVLIRLGRKLRPKPPTTLK
jgi:hypothetical protein